MTSGELQTMLVASPEDVEPLIRAARAKVAMLSLQLRSALRDADELEQQMAAADEPGAVAGLRSCLDEMVQSRRRELDRVLADERADADRLIDAARSEAAAIIARAAEDRAARQAEADQRTRAEAAAPSPSSLAPPTADAGFPPAVGGAEASSPALRVVTGEPLDEHDIEPPVPVPPETPIERASTTAEAAPEGLPEMVGQLIDAAIAAAVTQVLNARGPMTAAAAPWPPAAAGPAATWPAGAEQPRLSPEPANTVQHREPRRRSLLHLDVVLPLLAVLIVFVVLLAWVG